MKETSTAIRRKTRFEAHVGKEFSAAFLILIFLLLTFSLVLPSRESLERQQRGQGDALPRVFDQAFSPTTIATASVPVKSSQPINDFIDALTWIRNNQSVQVVVSWWDYGYWITTIGNKPSLADNGTLNSTQIGRIGKMFMSNETEALAIIQGWNKHAQELGKTEHITHVLVFTVFDSNGNDLNYGDETKWVWMAKIAGLDDKSFGNLTLGTDWNDKNGNGQQDQDETITNAKGTNTLLYKLMQNAKNNRVSSVQWKPLTYFAPAYFSNMNLPPEERTVDGINAVVAIYEVKY